MGQLRQEYWWLFFIDKQYHDGGEAAFDNDKSPGYSKSMITAFRGLLCPGGKFFNRSLDCNDYYFVHTLVTQHMGEAVLWASGTTYRAFPADTFDVALQYLGATWKDYLASIEELRVDGDVAVFPLTTPGTGDRPVVIEASATIHSTYDKSTGLRRIKEILNRYYSTRETIGSNEDDTSTDIARDLVRLIARTIRALHVGHFFRDGNGRLNCFLMLNKLLIDNGLSPTILPHGPSVFGGLKTVDLLALDIWLGMNECAKLVPAPPYVPPHRR